MRGLLSLCAVTWAGLMFATGAAAARDIQPPLVALRAPASNLVAARVVAVRGQPPALRVTVTETLRGRPRDALYINVPEALPARVEVGGDYLLVYGDLEPIRGKRGSFAQGEEGSLASVDGAAPAIYRDTPALRALLHEDHAEVEASADYKAIVLAGLALADPQLHDLWAAELAYRGHLLEALDASDHARIAGFVASADSHPAARARLLRAAMVHAPLLGDWYRDVARGILTHERVDSGSGLLPFDEVVHVAFEIVRRDPRPLEPTVLARWTRAGAPLLAEHALLKLRAQAPEAERALIAAALEEHLLPAATRALLVDHLRRLDLAADPARR